ncbi:MAG: flavodoxin [Oscillospiraceae bacterium]|nr:flavodoxin [Oscillospiraceae bacterium]
MKTIIVYYSMGGNVDFAAQKIAALTGAGLLRIEPKKAYPDSGAKKFLWGGKSAVMEEKPALKPYDFNASEYDLIIIGFPVWAGNVAPPLRTFVKENDLKGKRLAAFACQGGSGAEKALKKLLYAIGTDEFEAELVLNDPKDRPDEGNEAKIREFCGKLGF